MCPDERQPPADATLLELLARGRVLDGRPRSAAALYERLLRHPGLAAATLLAAGRALTELGEYALALSALQRGLALAPGRRDARHDLARCLFRLGDIERAVAQLEAEAGRDDDLDVWLALATLVPLSPSSAPARVLQVRRAFAERLAREAPPPPSRRRRPRSGSRLRVGYLSPDFGRPSYLQPVWGLVNQHDRAAVEVHLLVDEPVSSLEGYRGHPRDRVHETAGLECGELAERLQAWELDVLVDLAGFRSPARLPLFARPQPGIAGLGWFNHFATSGLPGLGWLIGDAQVHERHEAGSFSERVVRLPVSYLTFEPVRGSRASRRVPPAGPADGLVLGCLAPSYKLTPPVLDAWADILRQAPTARLRLANASLGSAANRAWLLGRFAERGVPAARLDLHGPATHDEFVRHYDSVDVALDTFPYSGGTTTMEALCAGVPVLTWSGDRWAARTTRSLLWGAGLGEWVAPDPAGYVQAAVRLCLDPASVERLGRLHARLPARVRDSPACGTRALARHVERCCRALSRKVGHG